MKSLAYLSILFYLIVFEVVGQDQYLVTRISGELVFDGKPEKLDFTIVKRIILIPPLETYRPYLRGNIFPNQVETFNNSDPLQQVS